MDREKEESTRERERERARERERERESGKEDREKWTSSHLKMNNQDLQPLTLS